MAIPSFFGRWGRQYTAPDMSRAYRGLFQSQLGNDFVLPDLAEFCHAGEPSPEVSDLFIQGRAAGRRDVWLRIQNHLNMSEAQIQDLYMRATKEVR